MTDEIKDDDPRLKGVGGTLLISMMKEKFRKEDAAKRKGPRDRSQDVTAPTEEE